MKQILSFILILAVMEVCAQIQYPVTRKEAVVEDYFGTKVEDPYRWLEDDNAEETKKWVIEQNKVTNAYLAQIPFRDKIKSRLEQLWNYPKFGAPFKKGDWYYYFKNDGLQNQSVLYRTRDLNDEPEVFLDPNTLSKEGIVALSGLSFSKSGKLAAYAISKAGSDWREIFVMDVETKKLLSDKIEWTKFSGAAWKGDEGFYYSAYDRPDESSKLSKANEYQKVYYHKIGTPQSEDVLVYEDKEHPKRYFGCGLTEDQRFLILSISEGTSGSEIWYRDLKNANDKEFKLLVKGFDTESDVVDSHGDYLLLKTNYQAPNYRVVLVDPQNPARENWKTVIPEQKEVLESVGTGGGNLFARYLKDASSKVFQYDYSGKLIREIELPGIGTAGGFGAEKDDREFYYSFSSFATPPTIYKYDIATGKSELYKTTEIKINTSDIITEQVFFTSKDGTKVPMFLTYKKGIKKDGSNPVLLYGYGGFNIPMTPSFSVSNTFFVEQGGIYVVVNLRGGSEYGEEWHKAGMLLNKQNVFDDFIAAAEYLIENKYTNSQKIAIRGGSNGGLLVGAVMTQRPELFQVAIPQVGVLDMLRFHKFTVGWGWVVEYGSADSAKHFPYLYKYSPYHNLKKGVAYPATLITTADHDDRVVPAHSFKFAARLQEYHQGANPVLIRIETNAGHGAGKPTSKMIEEAADIWAFTMYNLGMPFREQ
jgi:Serine proteases of the peptidase family S9A